MTAINKGRERRLLEAAEKALEEAGFRVRKNKFKHYTIEKNGARQNIAVRTSANRWLGFTYARDGWITLGDAGIDGFVIATYDKAEGPSEITVYPVIPQAELKPRFEQARAAYLEWNTARDVKEDRRVWVCLDPRSTGKVWDVGSGIVAGLTPIARYPLRAQANPEVVGEPKQKPMLKPAEISREVPKRGSIRMVVDLDEEEHRYLAERYAHQLEVDPRRLLVEVRLTFLV